MGVSVRIVESKFTIVRTNQAKALELVRRMPNKTYRWGASPRSCWELSEAFDTFGYTPIRKDSTGDIVDISLQSEKLGDEREFFEALAPAVEDGSYIEFGGDYSFRWCFEKGKLVEKKPQWE